jgi:RNA polymerase sigma factor (TIGR02999 family)
MVAEGITQMLIRWSAGERAALDELTPLVYQELRRLAGNYLRRRKSTDSLQPTLLVHEAWLRLVDYRAADWQSRAQFFGLAATIMRNLLVDYARRAQASKHGGDGLTVSLSQAERFGQEPDFDLLGLDQALQRLEALKPQHSRIIELRFFGGLTIEETATVIGVSHATVERDWRFARAWLREELKR